MPLSLLSSLANCTEKKKYTHGDRIDTKGSLILIISSGQCTLQYKSTHKDNITYKDIRILSTGGCIGEESLLSLTTHPTRAIVSSASADILLITLDEVFKYIGQGNYKGEVDFMMGLIRDRVNIRMGIVGKIESSLKRVREEGMLKRLEWNVRDWEIRDYLVRGLKSEGVGRDNWEEWYQRGGNTIIKGMDTDREELRMKVVEKMQCNEEAKIDKVFTHREKMVVLRRQDKLFKENRESGEYGSPFIQTSGWTPARSLASLRKSTHQELSIASSHHKSKSPSLHTPRKSHRSTKSLTSQPHSSSLPRLPSLLTLPPPSLVLTQRRPSPSPSIQSIHPKPSEININSSCKELIKSIKNKLSLAKLNRPI